MLILGRKPGDAIVIGGNIRVVLLACDQRGVRIGIEAPDDVSILREEILLEVADQNRRASLTDHALALIGPIAQAPSAGNGRQQHDANA